ncbi:hypothetical protein [Cetobacterium sp. SF1]|uniref:hypothetical protein n=1 Tax=Cetobacterium sp. SF1 TaxID=3417654 RepID=UPI003CFAC7AF
MIKWIDKEIANKIKEILREAPLGEKIQVKSINGLLESNFDEASEFFIYDKYYEKTGLVMCNRRYKKYKKIERRRLNKKIIIGY